MRSPELQAINVLSKDISLNLTINQLSKELGKSYGFTNKHINDFLDEELLSKKIVGSAILCSLNFSNEKTLGLLMLNSIEEKIEYLKSADKKKLQTIETLKKMPYLKSLFITDGKFIIVSHDKIQDLNFLNTILTSENIKKSDVTLIDQNEFKLQLKNLNLKKTTIIEGYEQFWRMISDMKS